ncbi:AAA domain-containing protein [Neobacillus bataviensis]|uniref:AAA domain-containing protein n=1 Tax=Neobacillus bataviensis TaxID=220685 RepID=A0A561DEB1_9BACI|nr:AAA domain-containing protein [Neobacillus bataviensis]TWE01730.1 AAA domain-containing protein [Neobacillus bataviensis]
MTTVVSYLKEWQQALQNEINYLKKFGSNKYLVSNGRLLSTEGSFSYYFETSTSLRIPVGSTIRLEWGGMSQNGRILSSEGIGVVIAMEQSFGDLISEATLYHDPWELLEQLIERLDEIKKDKQKRLRVKKLMDPSMPATHPVEKIKSTVHELVLRSKYNPVTFVWGPPGTGKTYTLARTAANKYFQEKRVLILSHSNQAVDVLIAELTDFIKKKNRFQEGDVLRYGFGTSEQLSDREAVTTSDLLEKQDPDLAEEKVILLEERKHLKQDIARSFSKRDTNQLLELETKIARVLDKIRQKEIQFVEDAFVVGTTLAKAASDPVIFEKTFDVVIVDEASMAYVPQAAFAAALGKRVIICGDFKQLPPIAASKDPLVTKWLKEDIFHRAGIVEWLKDGKLHPHLFLLKEQRRMHPEISAFTNQYIYQSLVGDHESVWKSRNKIVESAPFPSRSSVLVDTSLTGAHCITERTSQSRMNIWQVLLSFQLIHESYVSGLRSIGYVTPYRAQAQLMELILEDLYEKERRLADIIAATVHRLQGSERDVMIFDTVEGAPQTRAGMLVTGKDSERLINVAITRTRGKFIHVSNQAFIRKHVFQGKTLRQLVDHQVKKQQLVETKDIGTWIRHQHPQLQWMHARRLEKVFQDFDSVRESIVLSLPAQTRLTAEWEEKLKSRSKSVKLTVVSNQQWQNLQPEQRMAESLPFPFIIIDEALLWLGLPLEGAKEIHPPYVAARLESVKVSNYLLSQIITKE